MATGLSLERAVESARALLAGLGTFDGAEVFVRIEEHLRLGVANSRLDRFEDETHVGLALRLQRGGRVAQAASASLEAEHLKKVFQDCERRLADAPLTPSTPLGPLSEEAETTASNKADPSFASIPTDEKVSRLMRLEKRIQQSDPRLSVRLCEYEQHRLREGLWTQGSKRALGATRAWARVCAVAVAEEKGERRESTESIGGPYYFDLDWTELAKRLALRAPRLLGARPLAPGLYPVLLENVVMAQLLRAFEGAFHASNVLMGRSWAQALREGGSLSEAVSLIEDPFLKEGAGPVFWDAEGTQTRRLSVVERGRLGDFATSRASAAALGGIETGHAHRADLAAPMEEKFHHLYLDPGPKDFVDLMRDLNTGLLVTHIRDLVASDPLSGEFKFGADGEWVENGVSQYSVSGLTVSGSFPRLLAGVQAVGRDLRWLQSRGSPSALVSELRVD